MSHPTATLRTKAAILFCAMTAVTVTSTGATETLSLQAVLHEGLKGNLDLQRAELGTDKNNAALDEAISNYYPNLSASGSVTDMWDKPVATVPGIMVGRTDIPFLETEQGSRWTMTGGFTLTQPIFIPQAITGVRMARKALELDALGKQAQRDGVIQQLSLQYWAISYLEENLASLLKSRENLSQVRLTVDAMVTNGIARRSDLNSMDISIASLDAQIDQLKDQIQQQKANLLQAMGKAPTETFELSDHLNVESRSHSSPDGDPEASSIQLKLLDGQVKIKDMEEDLAGQARWPTLVAFAKYSTTGTSESFDFQDNTEDKFTDTGVLGIQLDIPIFDGFAASAKKSQARIERRQLQLDQTKLKLSIQADMDNAKRSLATARSQVERQLANLKLAEENFTMKEQEYREQVSDLSDLLQSENSVISARSNLTQALYSEKSAEIELERVLGLLPRRIQ